jgi:hypothetical protein
MSIKIQTVTDLPAELETNEVRKTILIQSEPDEDAIADGETDPFNWMDLRYVQKDLSRLIDANEVVLEATEATLLLSYPLGINATRLVRPADETSFTRGELVKLIDETYREIYRLETNSQSSPTPPVQERRGLINRPESDGTFGIWGHDLDDLGIEEIYVYRVNGHVWLHPEMVS